MKSFFSLCDIFHKHANRLNKEFQFGNIFQDDFNEAKEYSLSHSKFLKKYLNKPNIFIHFSDIQRFGFNPKYSYDTPFGIYGYSLTSDVLQMINSGTFAADRKYIHVFTIESPQERGGGDFTLRIRVEMAARRSKTMAQNLI